MPLFDWKCPRHGVFESSHPICPAMGCNHSGIEKTFLKPPGIRSAATKATDAGFRSLADSYGLTDMNNRGGQAVKGTSAGSSPSGTHWGTEHIGGMDNLRNLAARSGGQSGFMETARKTGLDTRRLPPADIKASATDGADRAKIAKDIS